MRPACAACLRTLVSASWTIRKTWASVSGPSSRSRASAEHRADHDLGRRGSVGVLLDRGTARRPARPGCAARGWPPGRRRRSTARPQPVPPAGQRASPSGRGEELLDRLRLGVDVAEHLGKAVVHLAGDPFPFRDDRELRSRAWRRAFSIAIAAWLASDESVSTSSISNPRGRARTDRQQADRLAAALQGGRQPDHGRRTDRRMGASRQPGSASAAPSWLAAGGGQPGPARPGPGIAAGLPAAAPHPEPPVRILEQQHRHIRAEQVTRMGDDASRTTSTSDSEAIATRTRYRARAAPRRASSSPFRRTERARQRIDPARHDRWRTRTR